MELLISISATNELEEVLRKTVKTILLPEGSKDTYGPASTSCYATVAKKLRRMWNDSWIVMYFAGVGNHVAHACLYDQQGNVIADTFAKAGGHPVKVGDTWTYVTNDHTYPVLLYLTLKEFNNRYLDKQG